jgi:hypothetical protein
MSKPNIEQISIKKFDISKLPRDIKCLALGKPATGKSTLIKDILYQHRKKFAATLVFSGTESSNSFYQEMIPDVFIYDGYDQDAMNKLIARQTKLVRKNGKGHPDNIAVLVNDDCMDDKEWVKNNTTRWLFKNGRHYDVFFLLAAQYVMDLSAELRPQIDVIFVLKQPILKDRRKIYENFAGIFPNFQMFSDVLDNLTEDYHCMVINNRVASTKLEDCVFWYKAEIHDKPFKVGTPAVWKYHTLNYNEGYLEEEENERIKQAAKHKYDAATRKKNAPIFVVNKMY